MYICLENIQNEDFDHKIVINPKYFKGASGKYASIWNQKPDKIILWKHAIYHEFTHSMDTTKKQWQTNDTVRSCLKDEYNQISLDERYFTPYANGLRHESYAEHGGYVSYMLSNPNDQDKLITIRYIDNGHWTTKDINFEEYIQLYPKHYDYFKKRFDGGLIE